MRLKWAMSWIIYRVCSKILWNRSSLIHHKILATRSLLPGLRTCIVNSIAIVFPLRPQERIFALKLISVLLSPTGVERHVSRVGTRTPDFWSMLYSAFVAKKRCFKAVDSTPSHNKGPRWSGCYFRIIEYKSYTAFRRLFPVLDHKWCTGKSKPEVSVGRFRLRG